MKTTNAPDLAAPAGLIAFAKKRTQAVVTKLRASMKTIEAEIDAHEGIYPLNGGKLSQAELCRRAGISNVTPPPLRTATRRTRWLRRGSPASRVPPSQAGSLCAGPSRTEPTTGSEPTQLSRRATEPQNSNTLT